MLKRQPKGGGGIVNPKLASKFIFATKAVIALEVLTAGFGYLVWNRLNHSQEFRHKVYNFSPPILNYYYNIGERLGTSDIRENDRKMWGINSTEK